MVDSMPSSGHDLVAHAAQQVTSLRRQGLLTKRQFAALVEVHDPELIELLIMTPWRRRLMMHRFIALLDERGSLRKVLAGMAQLGPMPAGLLLN